MELFEIPLGAHQPYTLPAVGSYFRILQGSGEFRLVTSTGQQTKYLVGLGIRLNPFDAITITSEKDQTIVGAFSPLEIDDNRLIGTMASGFNVGSDTIATKTSGELFPANPNRMSISITIEQPLYVNPTSPADNTGFLINAGTHTFENTATLYAFNDELVDCAVSFLEETI